MMAAKWRMEESEICGLPAIVVIGAFTMSHEEFTQFIKKKIKEGVKELVLDLRKTSFFASQGLASLIVGLKQMNVAGGKLYIYGPSEDMLSVFKLTLLDRVLLIAQDEAALRKLTSSTTGNSAESEGMDDVKFTSA